MSQRFIVLRCIYHGGSLPYDGPDDLTADDVVLCDRCEREHNEADAEQRASERVGGTQS